MDGKEPFQITHDQNFCRVFRLPLRYPTGYCFAGGHPCNFQLVDWFNPIPIADIGRGKFRTWDEYRKELIEFLRVKVYADWGRQFLVITDFGESFVFEGLYQGKAEKA